VRRIAGLLCAGIVLWSCAAGGDTANGAPGSGSARGRVRSGTGFFVSSAGFLLTSRHVVVGCPGLLVWADDGMLYEAEIIASDAQRDLALLSVNGRMGGGFASRYRDDLRRGEKVMTIGFGVVATNPEAAVFARGTFVKRGLILRDTLSWSSGPICVPATAAPRSSTVPASLSAWSSGAWPIVPISASLPPPERSTNFCPAAASRRWRGERRLRGPRT
jgi:hypothetical protein